jgi:hypothetical protein
MRHRRRTIARPPAPTLPRKGGGRSRTVRRGIAFFRTIRGNRIRNHFENAVDVAKHVIVPEAQHAITALLNESRSRSVGCIVGVLTTIDFDYDAFFVAGEVDNVSADPDLAAEVRTLHAQAVQVRPELLLGVGRHASHAAREH